MNTEKTIYTKNPESEEVIRIKRFKIPYVGEGEFFPKEEEVKSFILEVAKNENIDTGCLNEFLGTYDLNDNVMYLLVTFEVTGKVTGLDRIQYEYVSDSVSENPVITRGTSILAEAEDGDEKEYVLTSRAQVADVTNGEFRVDVDTMEWY